VRSKKPSNWQKNCKKNRNLDMQNKKVIIIDNYDSFTYNLVHLIEEILGYSIDVVKNDSFEMEVLQDYEYIVLSPGPGVPDEAGLMKEVIKTYGPSKKIFGVCLGLQAIGEVYGCQLKNLSTVFHGIKSSMKTTDVECPIFKGVSSSFEAGRYHSWVIDKDTLSDELYVTSEDEKGEIMAIRHKEHPVYAVQFHPESIMTSQGKIMLENFLKL